MAGSAWAQAPVSTTIPCNPWRYQSVAEVLSFQQRACYHLAGLSSPFMAARGATLARFGEWRDDRESFGHRFASFYARRSARAAGELVAGYLNHEDLRPRTSLEHGTWKRVRSALLSVVRVQDEAGNSRPAFAPLAGAFSSGFVGMALSPNRNSWNNGFSGAELTYSTYFARALGREFKPDLTLLANRILHRKKKDWTELAEAKPSLPSLASTIPIRPWLSLNLPAAK
ncbi:MAG TPA: hypothetical protein VK604_11885 [Bryobacteraceae bacterium]|nr:hypothetical protein [Bryobacteraceae bacterium]